MVGDVDPAHVIDGATKAFTSVPHGAYVDTAVPPLHYAGAHVTGDPFKLPTNYIMSVFAGPPWSDADFASLRLGMMVLHERVFDEVRTKRNLSYDPRAFIRNANAAPWGGLYVTAVDPNAAMKVMFDEVRRLQTELVPANALNGAKAILVSAYLHFHEPVDGLADALGDAVILGGDWHRANTLIEDIRKVTPEALRDAAKKWLSPMQTEIVGEPSKLDPKIVGAP